jgi:uncharacterized membrane protein
MSEQQQTFINELCQKFDEKYNRMQTFFIAIVTVILASALTIGYSQISKSSSTNKQVEINTAKIEYIYENSASTKAIDRLIETFDAQTRIMEQYLPEDVEGDIKEFNKTSSQLRSNIMMFNSNLKTRGVNKIQN